MTYEQHIATSSSTVDVDSCLYSRCSDMVYQVWKRRAGYAEELSFMNAFMPAYLVQAPHASCGTLVQQILPVLSSGNPSAF